MLDDCEVYSMDMQTKLATKALYNSMICGFDYDAVYRTARREQGLPIETTRELLPAFLQWFSLIPIIPVGKSLQMLGSVDRIWHAFILNMRLYEEFCRTFVGEIVYHDALDPDKTEEPKKEYARYTLHLLTDVFDQDIHSKLFRLEDNEVTCCFFKTEYHFGSSCSSYTDIVQGVV